MTDLNAADLGPAALDPYQWLSQFKARAEQLQKQGEAAQEAIATNEATVSNKLMRMTVSSGSQIKDLQFLTDAGRASASELTASFKELYARAGADVAKNTREVLASLAGEDDPSVAVFDGQLPDDVKVAMAEDEEESR